MISYVVLIVYSKCTCTVSIIGGKDFTELNSSLLFLAGERAKLISLTILDDEFLEEDEVFHVLIRATDDRVAVARGNASVTITDTDGMNQTT